MSAKPFSCPWDSGQVGWIYATWQKIVSEWGPGKGAMKKAEKCLLAEVEEYDQYLTGDVYGYIIEDEEGETVDSCWGFFGHKYAEEEGRQALKHAEKQAAAEEKEAAEMACRDMVAA
jgi:hypothetical protein